MTIAPDIRAVSVFCASSDGTGRRYIDMAEALGEHLAAAGVALVFGGSDAGLMGRVSNAHLAAGGRVIGVYPAETFSRDVAHKGLSELHEVGSMHERKALMYELSDAVIALPGGFGTLEELFEALTWTQLGLHTHPAALLEVNGFWEPLLQFLDGCVDAGVLKERNRHLITVVDEPTQVLPALRTVDIAYHEKWTERSEPRQ